MTKERIILGIDPGTIIMGYGLLSAVGNKPTLETMGVLQLNKYEDHYLRLRKIFERVLSLIDQYHPDELAIEAPFFGKNVQSMLKLGRAQGVAMAAALERDIPIFEYAPPSKSRWQLPAMGMPRKSRWRACCNGCSTSPRNPCCHNWMRRTDSPPRSAISSRRTRLLPKRNTIAGKILLLKIRIKFGSNCSVVLNKLIQII